MRSLALLLAAALLSPAPAPAQTPTTDDSFKDQLKEKAAEVRVSKEASKPKVAASVPLLNELSGDVLGEARIASNAGSLCEIVFPDGDELRKFAWTADQLARVGTDCKAIAGKIAKMKGKLGIDSVTFAVLVARIDMAVKEKDPDAGAAFLQALLDPPCGTNCGDIKQSGQVAGENKGDNRLNPSPPTPSPTPEAPRPEGPAGPKGK